MRILIVKLSALGDIVHTLPGLTTLRRHQPDAEIDWVVEQASAEILRDHPALNRLLVIPRREWTGDFRSLRLVKAARGFLGFVRAFRHNRYDLVVDFQGLAKSAVWVALARSRRKAGFGPGLPRNEGAWLALNERVPPVSAEVHALDRGLHLLAEIGFPRLPVIYGLPSAPAVAAETERLLRGAGIDPSRPFVAVNPMTRWATKNWEATRFAATADLVVSGGMPVVFTGGPGDRDAIGEIVGRMKQSSARLDGRTALPALVEVCRRATVMLTTDTGPMHIAAAVGTPVVALFGATSPGRTGPYGSKHRVLRLGLSCSPCFRRACQTRDYEPHACMLRLRAEDVAGAVLELASKPRPIRDA